MTHARAEWIRPAIFGAFDGTTCYLGVLFPLLDNPHLVLPAALGVGLAETVGMAAGEWQSDSSHGPAASVVIGAASGLGAVLPALPFALASGAVARIWSLVLIVLLTTGIGLARTGRGRIRAVLESFAILAAVAGIVWLGTRIGGGA